MRVKRVKSNPAGACKCNKCGTEAGSAIPGTYHRNCSALGLARMTTGRTPTKDARGVWEAV